MKKILLSPYLNFNGTAQAAMEFYHSILGGELKITTFGETGVTDDTKDQLMHADLTNDFLSIMASDIGHMGTVTMGDSVHLSLSGTDGENLKKYFEQLADGGKIVMPLEKQSWGDEFGMLTDKFGIHWMVNISSENI